MHRKQVVALAMHAKRVFGQIAQLVEQLPIVPEVGRQVTCPRFES